METSSSSWIFKRHRDSLGPCHKDIAILTSTVKRHHDFSSSYQQRQPKIIATSTDFPKSLRLQLGLKEGIATSTEAAEGDSDFSSDFQKPWRLRQGLSKISRLRRLQQGSRRQRGFNDASRDDQKASWL